MVSDDQMSSLTEGILGTPCDAMNTWIHLNLSQAIQSPSVLSVSLTRGGHTGHTPSDSFTTDYLRKIASIWT